MRGVLQCSGSSLSKHFGRAVEINTKLLYLRVSWGILILHLQVCQMKSCLNSLIFFNCLWNTISAVRIANKASFKTPKILHGTTFICKIPNWAATAQRSAVWDWGAAHGLQFPLTGPFMMTGKQDHLFWKEEACQEGVPDNQVHIYDGYYRMRTLVCFTKLAAITLTKVTCVSRGR